MNCQQVREKLEKYIDGELGSDERASLEAHVANCPECAAELANLQALNATGRVNIFPEPEPDYWDQLSASVMEQIRDSEAQSEKAVSWVEKIKAIVWPAPVKFRLASLAASAAIIFFFVHFAFFREGKFKMPPKSIQKEFTEQALNDSEVSEKLENASPAKSDVPQQAEADAKSTEAQKRKVEASKEDSHDQFRNMDNMTINPPASHKASGKGALMSQSPTKPRSIDTNKKSEIEEKMTPPAMAPDQDFEVMDTRQNQTNMQFFDTRMARPASLEKEIAADESTVVSTQALNKDEIDFLFQKAKAEASQKRRFAEKIRVWENVLKMDPPVGCQKRAIREQMQLHYYHALNAKETEQIEQAIKFYESNLYLFKNDSNINEIKTELEEIQNKLKNTEKK